jgi:sRNA-binding regulator protein Hfq
MGYLVGLEEYLGKFYKKSIFEQIVDSGELWEFHLHGLRTIKGRALENLTYDLKVDTEAQQEQVLSKVEIKLLYPAHLDESVRPLIKIDRGVQKLGLGPILSPRHRYFIKNKSLFPLMKDKEVVFFTLLEGEIIRGIISGFDRYEITVSLKGGSPVTILRHSIYDLRNKEGRCFLKSSQEKQRDWEKSHLFVSED